MTEESYKKLCEEMSRRGGRYPGKDIPEFYDLVKELFTPVEAAVAATMTANDDTAFAIARQMGKEEKPGIQMPPFNQKELIKAMKSQA
jgi:hypothetical protein